MSEISYLVFHLLSFWKNMKVNIYLTNSKNIIFLTFKIKDEQKLNFSIHPNFEIFY